MPSHRSLRPRAAAGLAATALWLLSQPAFAAECPADKVLKEPRQLEDKAELLLKRETLAEVKLNNWRGTGNLLLRMRRLTIEPGGFVPTHYHQDRPSIVFVVQGELVEHSTHCAVPVAHKAGEWTPEFGDFHGHWWENTGKETAVVLSADIIPPEQRDMPDM